MWLLVGTDWISFADPFKRGVTKQYNTTLHYRAYGFLVFALLQANLHRYKTKKPLAKAKGCNVFVGTTGFEPAASCTPCKTRYRGCATSRTILPFIRQKGISGYYRLLTKDYRLSPPGCKCTCFFQIPKFKKQPLSSHNSFTMKFLLKQAFITDPQVAAPTVPVKIFLLLTAPFSSSPTKLTKTRRFCDPAR